jgi:hypothetical protein
MLTQVLIYYDKDAECTNMIDKINEQKMLEINDNHEDRALFDLRDVPSIKFVLSARNFSDYQEDIASFKERLSTINNQNINESNVTSFIDTFIKHVESSKLKVSIISSLHHPFTYRNQSTYKEKTYIRGTKIFLLSHFLHMKIFNNITFPYPSQYYLFQSFPSPVSTPPPTPKHPVQFRWFHRLPYQNVLRSFLPRNAIQNQPWNVPKQLQFPRIGVPSTSDKNHDQIHILRSSGNPWPGYSW